LPNKVGLICGRGSAAEKDVVENARRRWPAVRFELRQVSVPRPNTVPEVSAALRELDADRSVDVIVITRGGGSFEDLLPFSNEALLRAVAEGATRVVSAIGHDVDIPLLDFVADVQASTPTDAAKKIVPDVIEQRAGIEQTRLRVSGALTLRLHTDGRALVSLRSRPVMPDPRAMISARRQ